MRKTYEELMEGNHQVTVYFQNAKQRWKEIYLKTGLEDTKAIAEAMHISQFWFEQNCGGQQLGQEIMVISCIARFYDTGGGFDNDRPNAQRALEAFEQSGCSLEIKWMAKNIAQLYRLTD